MNTTVVLTAEPTLLFVHPSTKNPKPDSISFSSQVSKSRISIRNRFGSSRTRPTPRIRAFYAPAAETTQTLYEVLGISDNDTFCDIKKAYKHMARKYHPDVSPPERVDENTRKFIMVHEAYETLSNPKSRASYDRDLTLGLRFGFSPKRTQGSDQRMEETGEWRILWESQLDGLKRRNESRNPRGEMSWGARMRSGSQSS